MSEPIASATSSYNNSVPTPWWVHLSRWLWKISAFLGVAVVLGLVVSVFAFWLTSSKGVIPPDSPAGWLIARWPVTLLVGGCFLLLALLTGVLSRWNVPVAVPLAPDQKNRVRMLQRLRRSYNDILVQSLQGAAWMELGLARQLDAVQNAATLLLRLSHRAEQLLPPGTPITQVYEEAAHELLILGEPGAGKSTLLLQLAQQLVALAEQDDTQPLPVLLPLSSWAVTRPKFQGWLAEQVAQTYDIPVQLARHWVQEEQLLPLLDGLDEMEEEAQPACIVAINAYHHDHPGPLVVCSRSAEYEEAAKQHPFSLQSAVVVQPLSPEQVDVYLTQAGKPLEALSRALNKNSALRELAGTPLMLSVLMLTYQGKPVRSLSQRGAELLQQVWTDYMQRMVERKGDAARYPLERTRSWLQWQAQQMQKHNQTVFYLEYLQPDWLPAGQQQAYTWLAVRVPGILIGVLASLIISLFLGYQSLVSLLQIGVVGGFLGGLFSEAARGDTGYQDLQSNPRHTRRRVIIKRTATSASIGLLYGLCFGLYLDPQYYGPSDWLLDGSIYGLVIGLSCWLLLALVPRFSSREVQVSATNSTRRWPDLRRLMHTRHGKRALLVAAVLGGGIGLSTGLSYGLRYGLFYGLSTGLFLGLGNGLLYGPSAGLSYWLLLGLFQGISHDRVEDRDRRVFNQGIRRSFRNSGIMGIIGGAMIWATGVLRAGLSAGLNGEASFNLSNNGQISGLIITPGKGLSVALLAAQDFVLQDGWLLAVSGGLLVWASFGGLAILRHAVLRLLLLRTHTFPWRAAPFLEDAKARILLRRVGGGYSFMHRLLLDYFA
jgi:NACHT domain